MHVGVYDHLGWAVVVTAAAGHRVADRRRIKLVEPGVASAPIHHEGKRLDDDGAAALVAEVRASARRATSRALDAPVVTLDAPIARARWPRSAGSEIQIDLVA